MRIFEILNETKLQFSKAAFEKAAKDSEFGVVYLTMTGDGSLYIGDGNDILDSLYPDASWRRSIKLTVVPAEKEISIRQSSFGNTLLPKVQQALRSLRDAKIIDNTWKIRTTREASYYDEFGKFSIKPNPIDTQGLDALVDKAIRLSPITKNMVLYHGTSSLDWVTIQKVGLHPLGYGTNIQPGSESRAKHKGNYKVLYLAGSIEKAMQYAKTRVDDQKRKNKIYDIEPVVLEIQVPDPARLVADDDVVNNIASNIANKLWKSKSTQEQKDIMNNLSQIKGFEVKDPTIGMMLWRETDEGFNEVMSKIPNSVFKTWKASLIRENQVGYKGIIPPKFIKRVL